MIDYFTREELLHCQYALVAATIGHQGGSNQVKGFNMFYPNLDIIDNFSDHGDAELAKKEYLEYLFPKQKDMKKDELHDDRYWAYDIIYRTFVSPLKLHHDIILVYDDPVEMYMDVLCDAIYEKFKVKFINLDTLFKTGRVGPIYLDIKKVFKDTKPMMNKITLEEIKVMESSEEGRSYLVARMNTQEKIKKLKKLGIKVSKNDIKDDNLDKILKDAWILND